MNSFVNVKIKNSIQVKNAIKQLSDVGFHEDDEWLYTVVKLDMSEIKAVCIFSSGIYQLLNFEEDNMIEPKDMMNSEPVKYFMEHRYV